jgi:hypothetical protein
VDKDDRQLCARVLCEVQPHGGSYFEYASFALHIATTKCYLIAAKNIALQLSTNPPVILIARLTGKQTTARGVHKVNFYTPQRLLKAMNFPGCRLSSESCTIRRLSRAWHVRLKCTISKRTFFEAFGRRLIFPPLILALKYLQTPPNPNTYPSAIFSADTSNW